MHILRHRLAQRLNSGRVGIAVLAVAQRLDGGLDDMRRGFEIGLADAEIDDVAPLALNSAARARTAKAFSSPMRSKAAVIAVKASGSG